MSRCLALLFVALATGSCAARAPEPCMSAGTCPDGHECLANRCTPLGGVPVAPDSLRLVVEPNELVAVSEGGRPGDVLPGAIVLGNAAVGSTVVYMRFVPVWRKANEITSAFLLLEPMPSTAPDVEDVDVRAWRVGGPWNRQTLSWLERPRLMPPSTRAIARSAPPLPLRVDVTGIVRYLAENEHSDHGIALAAGAGDGHGAAFSTGASVGVGPRLELYVR